MLVKEVHPVKAVPPPIVLALEMTLRRFVSPLLAFAGILYPRLSNAITSQSVYGFVSTNQYDAANAASVGAVPGLYVNILTCVITYGIGALTMWLRFIIL